MEQITGAAANGLNSLWHLAPIVTILLLIILLLIYLLRALLLDAKEERSLYRQTLMENTKAFNSLQEVIRAALSTK
jgi:uncharacterized membrane protein YqiK